MPAFIDITGQRFGRLVVLQRAPDRSKRVYWSCRCDCGRGTDVSASHLRGGKTLSCGCLQREAASGDSQAQGESHTRIYRIWYGMRQRCTNPRSANFRRYGGRGITICEEWADFLSFREWALANDYADHLTIDRIDNDGNYEPENCRWATPKQQSRNQIGNRRVSFGGVTACLSEHAELAGLSYSAVLMRLSKGWSIERALATPLRGGGGGK